MPRTPIGGIAYSASAATGADDVGLLEARGELRAAVELVSRRARRTSGDAIDGEELAVGDVDAIVIELRRLALGDRIVAEGTCEACPAAIDIEFGLSDFEAHRRPRRPRSVESIDGGERWTLPGAGVTFRIPTASDVLAVTHEADPSRALSERCVGVPPARPGRAGTGARALRSRAERALEALAPALCAEVNGSCPECQQTVALWVDARALCLADLRFLAGSVLEETHLLASTYHWRESEILQMVSSRRAAYADCIRAARGAPLPAEAFGG